MVGYMSEDNQSGLSARVLQEQMWGVAGSLSGPRYIGRFDNRPAGEQRSIDGRKVGMVGRIGRFDNRDARNIRTGSFADHDC